MKKLLFAVLLALPLAGSACLSMVPGAGGGGHRFRVLNATSVKICAVALKTDLNPDAGPTTNQLVDKMNALPPGAEGSVQVPVFAGPEKPTTFGVRAYTCRDNSMEPGVLIAELDDVDIQTTDPIVLR